MKKLTLLLLFVCAALCALILSGCEFLFSGEPVHRHMYDEWMITKNRTCTEDGERERYCSCGDKQTGIMAALGHDYVEYASKPVTCTKDGYEAYKICLRCGEGTEKKVIPALGHNTVSVEAKPATCTEAGHNAYEFCCRCDYTDYTEIPAIGHVFGNWEVVTAATCTQKGKECKVCKNDATHVEYRDIEILPHAISGWITETPPSCEADGLKYKECSVCSVRIETETLPATGHSFGEWKEETAATCLKEGIEKRVCSYGCNHTETRTTEKISHELSEWITEKEPGCETDGLKIKKCILCGSLAESEVLPALGHASVVLIIDEEATCEEVGVAHSECVVCKKIFETETIPATGHSFDDNVCGDCGHNFGGTKGLSWKLSADGTAYSLTGIGVSVSQELIIPETYNGKPVVAISFEAFRDCGFLTEIIIPESVTEIEKYAFYGCTNLKAINFVNVEGWTFYDENGNKISELPAELKPDQIAAYMKTEFFAECILKRN